MTQLELTIARWLALGIPTIEDAEITEGGFAIFIRDAGKLRAERYAADRATAEFACSRLNDFAKWRASFKGTPKDCIAEAQEYGHVFTEIQTTEDQGILARGREAIELAAIDETVQLNNARCDDEKAATDIGIEKAQELADRHDHSILFAVKRGATNAKAGFVSIKGRSTEFLWSGVRWLDIQEAHLAFARHRKWAEQQMESIAPGFDMLDSFTNDFLGIRSGSATVEVQTRKISTGEDVV